MEVTILYKDLETEVAKLNSEHCTVDKSVIKGNNITLLFHEWAHIQPSQTLPSCSFTEKPIKCTLINRIFKINRSLLNAQENHGKSI